MTTPQEIEKKLLELIPVELHGDLTLYAQVLAEVINGTLPENAAQERLNGADLKHLLSFLSGQQLVIDRTVLSFGKDNYIGNVTIDDVAGNNITKLNLDGDLVLGNKIKNTSQLITIRTSTVIISVIVIILGWWLIPKVDLFVINSLLKQDPTPIVEIAEPNETLIIVGSFDDRSGNTGGRVDVMTRTYDEITQLIYKQNIQGVRVEKISVPIITNDEQARQLGRRHGAKLVIWGWRDNAGAFVRGTSTELDTPIISTHNSEINLLNPTTVPVCLSREAPAQGSYLALFTLAQSLIEWDDQQRVELSLQFIEAALDSTSLRPVEEECSSFSPWNAYALRGHLYGTIALFLKENEKINESIEWRKKAISSYESAISLNDSQAWVYQGKAVSEHELAYLMEISQNSDNHEMALKYRKESISSLSKSLEVDAQWLNASILAYRADLYSEIQEYNNALQDAEQAIEADPEFSDAYIARGRAYIGINLLNLGFSDLDKGLSLSSDRFSTLQVIVSLLNERGMHDNTILYYEEMIRLQPDFALGYLGAGSAYYSSGQYEQSISILSQLLTLKDQLLPHDDDYIGMGNFRPGSAHVAAYLVRGISYAESGNHTNAIRDFTSAIELDPDFPFLYLNRGLSYAEGTETAMAIADFELFLDIYNGSDTQEALRKVAEQQLAILRKSN